MSCDKRRGAVPAETADDVSSPVVVDAPSPAIPAPSIPPSAPALQQLVRALGMREPDLRDSVRALVCMPRYPTAHTAGGPRRGDGDVCGDGADGDHRDRRGRLHELRG